MRIALSACSLASFASRGLVIAAVASTAGPASAQSVTWSLVAAAGQPAPGVGEATFDLLSDPRINDDGDVLFWAQLKGPTITIVDDGSLWSTRTGPLALALREGADAPGIPGNKLTSMARPALNAASRFACAASYAIDPNAPTTTTLAMIGEFTPGLSLIEQELPLNNAAFAAFPPPLFNTAGVDGAAAYAVGNGSRFTSTREGAPPAPPVAHYKAGDPAPGTAGLNLYFIEEPSMNGGGAVAFRASLTDKPVPTNPPPQPVGWAIFTDHPVGPGSLKLIAKTGDPAPGTIAGTTFVDVTRTPSIGGDGDVLFWGRLQGVSVTGANDTGLWLASGGTVQLIIREGDPAPGIGQAVLGELPALVPANESGEVAFCVALAGVPAGANSALFAGTVPGGLAAVLVEGDHAPGLAPGVTMAGFSNPAVNEAGQLAVLVRTDDPAIESENSTALYATDVQGMVTPLVATGDVFDIAGTPQTVDEIIWDSGSASSGFSQFNSKGELAVKLAFSKAKELSPGAILVASYACFADADSSGALDIDDFITFQTFYAIGDLRHADADGDGQLTIDDFIAFQTLYAVGC